MGWKDTGQVRDENGLAFAILQRDGAELMFQSFASALKDEPKFVAGPGAHRSSLFIEVEDFKDTLQRLEGYPITMPDRTTFYGMREVGVFEPGGHVAIFAVRL